MSKRRKYEALVARDGPSCWLCGKVVNLEIRWNSAWAPSLDHVVPRSKGGGNELKNLRLAHQSCNTKRGNLPESMVSSPFFSQIMRMRRWSPPK